MKYGKTKIPINVEIFQLMRDLLLSENSNITHKDLLEVKNFLSIIDFKRYTNTVENIVTSDYLKFLDKLVDASLKNSSLSRIILIQNLLNESKDKEKFQVLFQNKKEISNEDVFHLKKYMADHVASAFIFSGADELTDLLSKIQSGNYSSVDEITKDYKDFVTNSYKEINEIRVKEDDERLDTPLSNMDLLINLANETIKDISTPGFWINTGFKNLDDAMGGGLKRGALTLFGARTAGFKSGIMLNLAASIKLYSKDLQTFDKTKKPCVIYLSLENTQKETFKRLVTYALNKAPFDLVNYDANQLAREINNAMNPKTASKDLDLRLLYKKSNTVDINSIYSIINDIESDGYEVVALFVDYLATMKSRFQVSDQSSIGIAMADNARELYDLAISKNIAVVSGFQLNRSAYSNNKDVTGKETLRYVAESLKMTHFADYVFMINKDRVRFTDKNKEVTIDYIKFDEAKQRSTMTSYKKYFYEVFMSGNTFRMLHSKYYKKADGTPFNFEKFEQKLEELERIEENKKNQFKNTSAIRFKSNNAENVNNISMSDLVNKNMPENIF